MQLWRVYTRTLGDESVSERIVAADSAAKAQHSALMNVKAQNLGKGPKTQAQAIKDTKVLAVKKCGKDGVLTTNRIPVSAVEALLGVSAALLQELSDFAADMRTIMVDYMENPSPKELRINIACVVGG